MIEIKCIRCGRDTRTNDGMLSNITCQGCGCNNVVLTSVEGKKFVRIVCEHCKKTYTVTCGEPTTSFHDAPNCKGLLLRCWGTNEFVFDVSIPDTPSIKKKSSLDELLPSSILVSVIVLCVNLLDTTQHCIEYLRASTVPLQIVLVDNGSGKEVEEWARKQESASFIYVKNQINLGCCVGRNQGAKWATGDYLLFLDNDQFISKDLVQRQLDKNLDIVGVEWWDVSSHEGHVARRADSAPLGVNTYIGAGGMLVKRDVFLSLHGFDERYAPAWFEDVDFSFRAKAAGFTMGIIPNSGVIHLGNKTISSQKSFNSEEAKIKGQKLFSKEWGSFIKSSTWPTRILALKKFVSEKPKILLVVDIPNWAWDVKAKQIKQYLSDEFYVHIVYRTDMISFTKTVEEGWDILFTFECNHFSSLQKGFGIKVTGVTAHTYKNFPDYRADLSNADAIHANSMLLFKEVKGFNKNCYYVPNGVDEKLFEYTPMDIKNPFTVGYVGKRTARKGYDMFVAPACEKAGVRLKSRVGRITDENVILHNEMPSWYHDVDCIIVASDMDGTPNMLLEAAAIGRPCIGNKIGNIPEFIKDGKNGFIVERDIDAYVEKLLWMKSNRRETKGMGIRARQTVEEGWTWRKQSENYREMFEQLLDKMNVNSPPKRVRIG